MRVGARVPVVLAWAVATIAVLGASADSNSPFTVKFEVSNLDGENTNEVHTFYMEVHPDWVRM